MKQSNDSLGRTVMIAVIAGLLFAGFLALTPRLTAGTQTKGEAVAPASVGNADAGLGTTVSDPVVAIADVALDRLVVAVAAMLWAAGPLSRFIEDNPTIVMLALGFLLHR